MARTTSLETFKALVEAIKNAKTIDEVRELEKQTLAVAIKLKILATKSTPPLRIVRRK